MALSDDINDVTAQLSQVASQFPAAVSSALSTAAASGDDPALPAAISSLSSTASGLVSALQGSLPQAAVSSSLSTSS